MLRTLLFIVGCFFFVLSSVFSDSANSRIRRSRVRHDISNYTLENQPPRRQCDTDQLEYRLTRLEVQVAEKGENLRTELHEGYRRLQAMEDKEEEVRSNVEALRNDFNRFVEYGGVQGLRGPQSQYQVQDASLFRKLELSIDNLSKGMQLVVTALRVLNSDVAGIRRNISRITNTTSKLLQEYDNLATKDFLANSLIDVKHHSQPLFTSARSCGSQQQQQQDLPRNCMEIQLQGKNVSGFYLIQPDPNSRAFMALCDLQSRGGGWTLIHNRFDGSQDFYLNWHSYKHGFGNLGGEFWLGLEQIHQLTGSEVNELLVELGDMNQEKVYAQYAAFSVGSEVEGYPLKILGGFSGDAGDSLIYHAGSKFSTKDRDQDNWPEGSCAQAHTGAWWYRGCDNSNLNGAYLSGDLPAELLYHGMYWSQFRGAQYSLMQARMMIRPRNERSPPIFPKGIAGPEKN